MKKLLALLLALSMLTALTACGKKNDEEQKPEQPSVEDTAPETEDTTEPEVEDTTETPEAGDTTEPETDAPAAGAIDLNAFYESIAAAAGENWPAMMPLDSEALGAFYAGLNEISTKSCAVYMPMMSSVVCEIALVEVENEADVQAVKDIFEARIAYQVGDDENPGGAWYPESIEGWKNNSRVVSNGNCVMMIAFSECDAIVEQFNAL